jgi:uncharacterized protein
VNVNLSILVRCVDDMIIVQLRRVILNPGAESDEVIERLESVGIEVDQACARKNRIRE